MPAPQTILKTSAHVAAVRDRRSDGGEIQTDVTGRRARFNPVASALLGLVWVYQKTLSPLLPAVLGPSCGCRFSPTCSHYAADALRTHGVFAGLALAAIRLLKCSPLHPGGFDPVPPARAARGRAPRCTRVSA